MPTGVYKRTTNKGWFQKGYTPWSKGLTKENDERIKRQSEKMSKLQKGEGNNNWKGGRYKHTAGYIFVKKPEHPNANNEGYVREHILVMEKKLDRYLKPKELVHHINGIKDDNRPENLYLFSNSRSHLIYERNLRETYLRWIRAETNNKGR